MRVWTALWSLFTRQLRTRGRIAALVLLSAGLIALGWLLGVNDSNNRTDDAVTMLEGLGLALIVPLITMLYATNTLGGLREDKTLVHVWLTPTPGWVPVSAAWAAASAMTAPLLAVVAAVSVSFAGAEGSVVAAAAWSTGAAAVAYVAVFTLIGLVLRRSLVWGIVYILFWEGFLAGTGSSAAALSIRAYGSAILRDLAAMEPAQLDRGAASAAVVLALVTVGALLGAVAVYRNQTVE